MSESADSENNGAQGQAAEGITTEDANSEEKRLSESEEVVEEPIEPDMAGECVESEIKSEIGGAVSPGSQVIDEVLLVSRTDSNFQFDFKPCDRYGFYKDEEDDVVVDPELYKIKVEKENERLKKWVDMFGRWSFFNERNSKKLKSRVRKGIPDAVRGRAWMVISRADEMLKTKKGVYSGLVAKSSIEEEIIQKDIARTFPTHDFFATEEGMATLFRVLKAYAVFDSEIGYCQGMGFIAALFLSYVEEESAFWLLVRVMKHYNLRENFKNGMPGLQLRFFQFNLLVRKFSPRLYKLLESKDIHPSLYSTGWFLTHFLYNDVPFEYTLRIWDIFIFEGVKVIFRMAVMIMVSLSEDLLTSDQDEILSKICRCDLNSIFSDKLFEEAYKLKFGRKTLRKFRNAYNKKTGGQQ